MFESMATLILVTVGLVLFLFILAFGIYITFYPLSKTIKGGIEAMSEYADEKQKETVKVPEREDVTSTAAQVPPAPANQEAHNQED